jgi:hypothetical protein
MKLPADSQIAPNVSFQNSDLSPTDRLTSTFAEHAVAIQTTLYGELDEI